MKIFKSLLFGVSVSIQMLLLCFLAVSTYIAWVYLIPYRNDMNALQDCKGEDDVIAYFKRPPEMVYYHLDEMAPLGWRLPSRPVTNKIIVYTRRLDRRYYIYIDGNGNVEYVFTASE